MVEQEVFVTRNFLTAQEVSALSREVDDFYRLGFFKPAGIGKDAKINNDIRKDEIMWLDPARQTPAQEQLWKKLDNFKKTLNERYYLGLWDFEGHYSVYPVGAFYKKHVDTFKSDDLRTLSFIVYLNENWKSVDGGCLRVHKDGEYTDVEPRAGTMVCFLSHKLEHEVLESKALRKSFTGWFKKRAI